MTTGFSLLSTSDGGTLGSTSGSADLASPSSAPFGSSSTRSSVFGFNSMTVFVSGIVVVVVEPLLLVRIESSVSDTDWPVANWPRGEIGKRRARLMRMRIIQSAKEEDIPALGDEQ